MISMPEHDFAKGDAVYVRDFASGPKWLPGVITATTGPLSYHVTLQDNRVSCCHVDRIGEYTDSSTIEPPDVWLP